MAALDNSRTARVDLQGSGRNVVIGPLSHSVDDPSLPPKLLIVNQVKKKDGATPPSQMEFFLFHQFCWWDDDDVSNAANICQQ